MDCGHEKPGVVIELVVMVVMVVMVKRDEKTKKRIDGGTEKCGL